mgnify:CR=1 FL=1|tara:strand:+ start:41 stop:277 length:237 start_codon:yes stop_codon:yes gene_type:complete
MKIWEVSDHKEMQKEMKRHLIGSDCSLDFCAILLDLSLNGPYYSLIKGKFGITVKNFQKNDSYYLKSKLSGFLIYKIL